MKKHLPLLVLVLLVGLVSSALAIEMPFRELSPEQIVKEMGLGWNLGNTMDGHTGFTPSETCWQPTITTQKLITAVHDGGFNTLRLPVTWGTMIDDESGYQINEEWLSRVQDIADYAVKQNMYVIINIHHDGAEQMGWLRIGYTGQELETVKNKFAAVWGQIALCFQDYDEHVIFESMNEVVGDDNTKAGWDHDYRTIEALNQLFVDTVRATGGNNESRWLLCAPRYTNIANTLNKDNGFKLPTDKHIMLSVHDYDYSFGILANMGATFWGQEKALALSKQMESLKAEYTDRGIPVVLGEYGAVNKNNDGNRAYYYEAMCRMASLCGIVPVAWDIGWYDQAQNPDYTFSLFDRSTGQQLYPGIISAMLRGYYHPVSGNLRRNILAVTKIENAGVAPLLPGYETIAFVQKQLFMVSGESVQLEVTAEPQKCQDTIVYSSTNPEVATVSNGFVQAKMPGSTKITASSQGGGASGELILVVQPAKVETPVTEIEAEEAITLFVGEGYQLKPNLSPMNHRDTVYYASGDERVVTVNPLGKLVAIGAGNGKIIIKTASGFTKAINVTVEGTKAPSAEAGLPLAIGVYYNDSVHGHYANETGGSLSINGNGTYTLTFGAAQDLSGQAREKGVTDLTGVGAIYIFDVSGTAKALSSCDIHYDEILLDGQAVVIEAHEPKPALKSNGKLDTNDPFNAWDGSVSKEVTAAEYVLSFANQPAPKTVSITFTLTNWE